MILCKNCKFLNSSSKTCLKEYYIDPVSGNKNYRWCLFRNENLDCKDFEQKEDKGILSF